MSQVLRLFLSVTFFLWLSLCTSTASTSTPAPTPTTPTYILIPSGTSALFQQSACSTPGANLFFSLTAEVSSSSASASASFNVSFSPSNLISPSFTYTYAPSTSVPAPANSYATLVSVTGAAISPTNKIAVYFHCNSNNTATNCNLTVTLAFSCDNYKETTCGGSGQSCCTNSSCPSSSGGTVSGSTTYCCPSAYGIMTMDSKGCGCPDPNPINTLSPCGDFVCSGNTVCSTPLKICVCSGGYSGPTCSIAPCFQGVYQQSGYIGWCNGNNCTASMCNPNGYTGSPTGVLKCVSNQNGIYAYTNGSFSGCGPVLGGSAPSRQFLSASLSWAFAVAVTFTVTVVHTWL